MKLNKEARSQKVEVSSKLKAGATKGGVVGPVGRAPTEAGQARQPAWWASVPAGEKYVLRLIVDHLRKAKADPTMAAAAAKWETRLICFIKFRLIGQAARWQVRSRTGIQGQSTGRSTPLRRPCRA